MYVCIYICIQIGEGMHTTIDSYRQNLYEENPEYAGTTLTYIHTHICIQIGEGMQTTIDLYRQNLFEENPEYAGEGYKPTNEVKQVQKVCMHVCMCVCICVCICVRYCVRLFMDT